MKKMEARCWATWVMIGFGLLLSALAFYVPEMNAHAGLGTSPSAPVCKPGAVCKPTGALMVMAPVTTPEPTAKPAPAPTESGLGTSPSWMISTAITILGLMQALKTNERVRKFLASDGWGFGVSLLLGAIGSFLVDYTTPGRVVGWLTLRDAAIASILASGGYSAAWLRFLKPKVVYPMVTKLLGGWPEWLGKVKA